MPHAQPIFLGFLATIVMAAGTRADGEQHSCFAAEPVMLSLMVQISDYCPGLRLTEEGRAAFTDVWNRGEHLYGALFLSRCVTRHITGEPRAFGEQNFPTARLNCDSARAILDGWRSEMTKKRGPLAERVP